MWMQKTLIKLCIQTCDVVEEFSKEVDQTYKEDFKYCEDAESCRIQFSHKRVDPKSSLRIDPNDPVQEMKLSKTSSFEFLFSVVATCHIASSHLISHFYQIL